MTTDREMLEKLPPDCMKAAISQVGAWHANQNLSSEKMIETVLAHVQGDGRSRCLFILRVEQSKFERNASNLVRFHCGDLPIASSYTKAKFAEVSAARARYRAACNKAVSLYSPEKTNEWKAACELAQALSKTVPLTIAKRKLADGSLIDDDEE